MIISWAAILILVIPIVLIIAAATSRRPTSETAGIVKAFLMTTLGCLLLGGLLISMYSVRSVSTSTGSSDWSARHEAGSFDNDATMVVTSGNSSNGRIVTIHSSASEGQAVEINPALTTPQIKSTQDGEMLLVPLSSKVLVDMLGEEGAAAVESLNASLSPEMRQAYAMIPIAAPRTVPSFFNGAVAPSIMKHAFSKTGIDIFNRAVSEFMTSLPDESIESDVAASSSSVPATLLAEASEAPGSNDVHAAWIKSPIDGMIVVKSRMLDPAVSMADALRTEISDALKLHLTETAHDQLDIDGDWQDNVDLQIADNVLEKCIVETDTLTEVIPSVDGDLPMKQTFALIRFPKEVETKAIALLNNTVKQNRLIVFCAAIGCLWLSTTFLSVAVRAGQSTSIFRKLATLPVMGLLIIPCLVGFGVLTKGMIDGKTFELGPAKHHVVCVVDNLHE